MRYVLAIYQLTTPTRAILFDAVFLSMSQSQEDFTQHFPQSVWVEHDPAALWATTLPTCRAAIAQAGIGPQEIAAIGITNQRELD